MNRKHKYFIYNAYIYMSTSYQIFYHTAKRD